MQYSWERLNNPLDSGVTQQVRVYDTHSNKEEGRGTRSTMMTANDVLQRVVIEL
jgi:hypothetical protein